MKKVKQLEVPVKEKIKNDEMLNYLLDNYGKIFILITAFLDTYSLVVLE